MPTVRLDPGPVATLTLDRPDRRNAMTAEMADEFAAAVERVVADPAVRVLVVRGEGKTFCAGGDFGLIEAAASRTPEENRIAMRAFYGAFLSIARVPVPTVAAVQGAAIGAGLCLAAACDLRVVAEDARLAANFVRLGLHPGMAATALLPRLCGPSRAAELLLTGRTVTGAEAPGLGLAHRAVPAADLDAVVREWVDAIASAAPVAVRQCRQTLARPAWAQIEDAMEREAAMQAIDFATADLAESVAAIRGGRAPVFQGR